MRSNSEIRARLISSEFRSQRATRPSTDQLTLDGKMDGHDVHMQLKLVDRNKFLLVNRGFHWVQAPFIR